jgi:hypothetical protein
MSIRIPRARADVRTAALLLLVACAPKPAATPAAVGSVIDEMHALANKADEAGYFALFADNAVFLGTDGKERWTIPEFRAFAHPYFQRGRAWSFRSVRRTIDMHGDVAWFEEDLSTPNLGPARGSGVLVRNPAGAWKIAQYNLSVPIPNERLKAVKALIEAAPPPTE